MKVQRPLIGSLSLSLSAGLIKQFLRDVDWGDVDYLVIDTPPGTSDEHISVVQYLSGAGVDGAVLVTTPQVQFLQDEIFSEGVKILQLKIFTAQNLLVNKWEW